MSRRPTGDVLQWLLATLILVTGSGLPMRMDTPMRTTATTTITPGRMTASRNRPVGTSGRTGSTRSGKRIVPLACHLTPPLGLPTPDSGGAPTQASDDLVGARGPGRDCGPSRAAALSWPAMTFALDRLLPHSDRFSEFFRNQPGPPRLTSSSDRS